MEGTRDHLPATALPEPRVLLRRHGLRCAPGRLRILALLRACEGHLSTAEACTRLAQTGAAIHATTVYRTLEALTAVGLTHAVPGPGPTRYGITGEPHHHAVCQQCGHVMALASEHLADAEGRIEELTGRPAMERGRGESGRVRGTARRETCAGPASPPHSP